MKNILCDECKRVVGMIEDETFVDCEDRFYGVEILCKECKDKKPVDYWEYKFKDVNVLMLNQRNDLE